LFFKLTDKNTTKEAKRFFIHGVEEDKEDDDDREKILFSVVDQLKIDIQPNDPQSAQCNLMICREYNAT